MPGPGSARIPIFDGHNDALTDLLRPDGVAPRDLLERGRWGHLDVPRARDGGFAGGLFAVFVPRDPAEPAPEPGIIFTGNGYEVPLAAPLDPHYAQRATLAALARLFRLESRSAGQLRVARSAADIDACLRDDVIAAVPHLEGADAIDPDLDALEVLYHAGVRSLGVVWSRPNAFGHGVPFAHPRGPNTGPGLTAAGRDLIRECNRLRILLDVSHLNERGFWDVAAISDAPLVATHSNAHAVCPAARNLTDAQLDAIRDSDGLVGVNLSVSELRPDGHLNAATPLDVVVRHVDHLVARLGADRVAFGLDLDGATIPDAVGDAAGLQRILEALRAHGYDEATLRKVAHENWLRALRRTWGA